MEPTRTLNRQPCSGDQPDAAAPDWMGAPSYPASRTDAISASTSAFASGFQTTVARFSARFTSAPATPGVACNASVTCRAQFEHVIPSIANSVFIDAPRWATLLHWRENATANALLLFNFPARRHHAARDEVCTAPTGAQCVWQEIFR